MDVGVVAGRRCLVHTRAREIATPARLRGPASLREVPPSSYSPTRKPGSTIADAGLNFRVRNGNGCGPRSMDGGIMREGSNRSHQPNSFLGPTEQCIERELAPPPHERRKVAKPHGRLVPVSSTRCRASTSGLSTSSSRTALQGNKFPGRPGLEVGFPLRCFQRLSLPNLATRRCSWRNNRYTSGSSIPVLSY